MHVLKFGGTSVGSVENIRRVGEILHIRSSGHKPLCVVVSAFAGVTNQLQKLTELAPRRSLEAEKLYEALRRRHEEVIRGLGLEKDTGLAETVHDHFTALWETVRGSYLLRECSVAVHDRMLGFGERLSAPIISAYLRSIGINSAPLDGTDIFISDDRFGGARINRKASLKRTEQAFRSGKDVYVVTGFVAASEKGAVTTLGRGGSDYTAAVLAAMLHAPEVEIWTDVSGIMTANPAVVRGARRLSSITYAEAMELSHFGAGVLYGPTIQPAMEQNIPIRILNTFKPLDAGTVINKSGGGDDYPVTGITAIDDVALLTMEGSGMAGVPGVAARLFGYLAAADINVILITQASSEHSICVAVAPSDMKKARRAIESGFRHEIKAHEIDPVKEQKGLSVLAVVGQNMRHKPGIAGKVFRALGRRRINVYAIAQGSSELNVSVVLEHDQLSEALNAVHDAFFDPGRVAVYCVGAGTVGGALLEMFKDAGDNAPRLAGLANSRRMLVDERGMAPGSAREALVKGRPLDMATFTASIPPGSVFVDCTASEDVAGLY
ncbi:MAG: aspartate kinase, partial [Calditrichaeota bacterium]